MNASVDQEVNVIAIWDRKDSAFINKYLNPKWLCINMYVRYQMKTGTGIEMKLKTKTSS